MGVLVSISMNMSRALWRGAGRGEVTLPMGLNDGGSILAPSMIERPTFRHLNAQRSDIARRANNLDRDDKLRADIPQLSDGERCALPKGVL